jgi:uncharacterized protein (UPF0305 family)
MRCKLPFYFSRIVDPFINDLLNKVDQLDREDHSEIEKREKSKEKYDKSKVLLSMTDEWMVLVVDWSGM